MSKELKKLQDRVNQLFKEKNWDEAITVCTDFINSSNNSEEKVKAYITRGIAYSEKGEHGKAIEGFGEAIELNPEYTEAYFYRGIEYGMKGEHDKAIKDFDEAINLDSEYAQAYLCLGLAYYQNGDYKKAFDDWVKAGEHGKGFQSELPGVYIVFRLVRIFGSSQVPLELKSAYLDLLRTVEQIKTILFYKNNESEEVAHYTSLEVLKNLVDTDTDTNNHSFRLYNAAYMNDPEEGRVFFEVMKDYGSETDLEKTFYSGENAQRSPAYIGSFVKIEADKDKDKDKLFLWRTYGKDNDEEAAGACLILDRNQFANSPPLLKVGGMPHMQPNAEIQVPELENVPYKICYKDEIEDKERLAEYLTDLSSALKAISSYKDDKWKNAKAQSMLSQLTLLNQLSQLDQLVRELLDSIRFLFKADHYREEQEVRVIEILQVGKETSPKRKIDTGRMPPRFYMKMPKDIKFSEVILGPRTPRVPEWKQWLKENGINKAEPSRIPFGKSV